MGNLARNVAMNRSFYLSLLEYEINTKRYNYICNLADRIYSELILYLKLSILTITI